MSAAGKAAPRCPFFPRFVFTRGDAIIAGDGQGNFFASSTPFPHGGAYIAVAPEAVERERRRRRRS